MDYSGLALFSDLDGTLFNRARQVSPENRAALERFCAQGGLFGVSTGRAPLNALSMLPQVPVNTWSVVLNGAEAYQFATGTVAFPRLLPQLRMAVFLTFVLETMPRVNVLLCSESRMFFLSSRAAAEADFLASHQPCVFASLEKAMEYPWLKVLFCAPRPLLEALEQSAREMDIPEVANGVYTAPNYLEFMPRGVHKGRCLRDLRCLDVLRERKLVAVGDWTNDLELLQEADYSAAVENALPEVKAVAQWRLPSNEENAIACLIDEILPTLA